MDQWIVSPSGGCIAISIPSIESTMRIMGIEDKEAFDMLILMGRAYKNCINEAMAKEKQNG